MRINKYISDFGQYSRRAADKLVAAGKVKINKKVAMLGDQVAETDQVTIENKPLSFRPAKVYLAFNKPRGIICTTDVRSRDNIIKAVNYSERIFPVGRLDVASSGLILLTNDGDIVNKLLRQQEHCEKEYLVKINKKITPDFLRNLRQGVNILGRKTLPAKVTPVNAFTFKIILEQGLNRQIRRMCEKLGYEVTGLQRIRIKNIKLGNLAPGAYRKLSEKETAGLLRTKKLP